MKKEVEPEDPPDRSHKNDPDDASFANVTTRILGYRSGDVDDLDEGIKTMITDLRRTLSGITLLNLQIMSHATYKHDGKVKDLPKLIMSKLRMFVVWVSDKFISKSGELTHWDVINLRKQDFNDFHSHGDFGSPGPSMPLIATLTPGASSIMSASQKLMPTSRRGPNKMPASIPSSRMKSTMILSVGYSMPTQRVKEDFHPSLIQISSPNIITEIHTSVQSHSSNHASVKSEYCMTHHSLLGPM